MRLNYELKLWQRELTPPKYHIVQICGYQLFEQLKENLKSKIRKDLSYTLANNESWIYHISNIFDEPLKNSFDWCKKNYLWDKNFIWKITINIILNIKRKTILIIIKDNWAGINISNKDKKQNPTKYLWKDWIWLKSLTKSRTDWFRLERDYNWATIILKKNI